MNAPSPQRYVLVGIDGSQTDGDVLTWAVREARQRGHALAIAYAWGCPGGGDTDARSWAQTVLDGAVARVRAAAPGVVVDPHLVRGHAVDVLLDLARSAEVTVVGAGRRRLFSLGPVAERVVDHAPGPVVIMHGGGHATVRSIAVGVDPDPAGREESTLAVEFAVEEARLNGARLEAVASCWSPEPSAPVPGQITGVDLAARRVAAGRALEDIVGPYAEKYPEVQVSARVTTQPPGPALQQLAEQCDLIVVGSRGRGPAARFMLGSVGNGLARHAGCPVAIVHGIRAAAS